MSLKILITGATRGLGYWLTGNFLEQGNTVYALNKGASRELTELQKQFPQNLHTYQADVKNLAQIQAALTEIARLTSSLDIIVNNAAVYLEDAKDSGPEEINFEKMQESFDINAVGPLRIIKTFLPLLRKGRSKLIANISSEAGSITNQFRSSEYGYCMSKAALNMATRILQTRLQSETIKVVAIHPGWFSSDMGGPEAPITPAQAAASVAKLILREWQAEDPTYLDAVGNKLDW